MHRTLLVFFALLFLCEAIPLAKPRKSYKDQEAAVEARVRQIIQYASNLDAEMVSDCFIQGGVLNLDVSGNFPYIGPIAIREYLTSLFNSLAYLDTLVLNYQVSGAPGDYHAATFDLYLASEVDHCRVALLQKHAIYFVSATNLSVVSYSIYFDDALLASQLTPPGCKNSSAVIAPPWPHQFTADFLVAIADYGANWQGSGKLFYNYDISCQRAIFRDFCMPLFDPTGTNPFMNFTCSYIIKGTTTYFINITDSNTCCILSQDGVPPPNPKFMQAMDYRGRINFHGRVVDEFWIEAPPPYGPWFYRSTPNTDIPVSFQGPVPIIGQTDVRYQTYNVIPDDAKNSYCDIPLLKTCTALCPPPSDPSSGGHNPHGNVVHGPPQ